MNNKYIIGENIDISAVSLDELNKVLLFQKEIIDNMVNKDWFVPLTEEEFIAALVGRDNVYFLLYKDEIIGLFVLTCDVPKVLADYKLPDSNYMLIDSIMIKEEYRGYGLHKQILQYAYERARRLKMNGLVASVHPDNKYSLYNFIASGYEFFNVLIVHGGMRNIYIKRLI